MKRTNKKFAVLELFLILAILVFLSSLVVPNLKSNSQKAKHFEKEYQVKTIAITENIYKDLK